MSRVFHEMRNSLPNYTSNNILIDFDDSYHILNTEGCPPDSDMSIESFLNECKTIEAIGEQYKIRLSPRKGEKGLFDGELEIGDSTENFTGNLKNCYRQRIKLDEKDWRITICNETISFDLALRVRYKKEHGTIEFVDSCFGKTPRYERPKSLCIIRS